MSLEALPLKAVKITAISLATWLILIAGCTSEQPPQTAQPDQNQEYLLQEIEELNQEITSLREELHDLRNEEPNVRPERTPAPPEAENRATPPLPKHEPSRGDDICTRHPKVQDAILQTIRSARCEGVSNNELFRIQEFRDWRLDDEISLSINETPLQPGDFSGLVNLKSLDIYSDAAITRDVFSGARIDKLTVRASRIDPGAFDGAEVAHLRVEGVLPAPGSFPETLTSLDIDELNYGKSSSTAETVLPNDYLEGMKTLEKLSIYDNGTLVVPRDALAHTPNLREVKIGASSFTASRTLVAGLSHLEYLRVKNLRVTIEEGEDILVLHPESPLAEHVQTLGEFPFTHTSADPTRFWIEVRAGE